MIQSFLRGVVVFVLLFLISLVFSFLSAGIFASIYEWVTSSSLGGSFLDFTDVVGLILALLFSFAFFGGFTTGYYRVIMLFLCSIVLVFLLAVDLSNSYFSITLFLFGLILGWGLKKIVSRFKEQV